MKKTNKKLVLIIFSIFLFSAVLLLQSFYFGEQQDQVLNSNARWPSKSELRKKLWQIRKVLLVYGTGNPEYVKAYQNYAERYAQDFKWIEIIVEYLENSYSSFARSGDFRVFRNGQGIVFGFFKQEKNARWVVNYERTRNYLRTRIPVLKTEHFVFIYHGNSVPRKGIKEFANQQEQQLKNLLKRLDLFSANSVQFPQIACHLYESLEDKGLMTGNTDLSHFDLSKWEIHAIFNEDLRGDDFYSEAKLVISKYLGDTKSQALRDGLGVYFSKGWRKLGFRYWAKLFHQTGNIVSLQELLDSSIYKKESYLFMRPLAGGFVDFLITKFGEEKFLDFYRNLPESGLPELAFMGETLEGLQKGWFAYLDTLKVGSLNYEVFNHPKFQKGFCYAHEGYQIYNGYLSRKSFESLKKLRSLGVEWISLTPFGYLDHLNRPGYFHYSFGAGSENDESILTANIMAKKLGMKIMLKPHVLMYRGHLDWPGDIKMKSAEDWENFFNYYYRWIRHYALLAEMYKVDIFCIGVELVQATLGHEVEWREMISKIRQIYHGPLVYAANWGEEFENLKFWDALDYIGLNCYYPLSNKDAATIEDLKKGAAQMLPKIEKVASKYQKPVLLTEVGFSSTAKSWQNPHKRNRASPIVLEDQALAYRAIFETFWNKQWFYGLYWWKWPTYLEYGGKHHNGFTPNGKPAEKVVKEWYLTKKVPSKILKIK
ncbi:MAG: hypothetical protein ACE5JB_14570 [bacterium]